jgi:hypothetical protein
MRDKSRTGFIVILAVAAGLLSLTMLAGCSGQIGERISNIARSLRPAATATMPPPTVQPPTAEPQPTSIPPTAVRPSPTFTARPTNTAAPAPSATPTRGPDAVVTADALTLRGGPGTVYPRLGMLRKGDPLAVAARTGPGDWLAVTTSAGKRGWVAAAYVSLNVAPEGIPISAEVPPTPVPPPTQSPTAPSPAETTPGEPSPTIEPPANSSVDDEIAAIDAGDHGQLPQPSNVGAVTAGGQVELTILNDTPYVLTVLLGSPNQAAVTVDKCPTCSTYGAVGPLFCQEEGRPRQTIRIKPGTMKVAARVDNPSVIPFSGQWTLDGDNAYFNCFFIAIR